ncbi:MAG TPA: putative lipid II flippase FtsW [Myxococcota bacterium]|jgi:cell division protein FtsW|nr:putative lipid II flippase FtsW [Myxococcota bacterium]
MMNAGVAEGGPQARGREGALVAAALLTLVGAVTIYSATTEPGQTSWLSPYFLRHAEGVLAAAALGFLASRLPLSTWRRSALVFWLGCVALLAATLVLGVRVNGARRWLEVPGVGHFQPVEFAKVATLLVASSFLARRQGDSAFGLRGLLPIAVVVGIPTALLLGQPDLGNAAVLCLLVGALLFVAGAPLRLFVVPAVLGALGLCVYVSLRPYAASRVTGFLHPWETAGREGYQLVQSFVGFGRGGLFGVGLGGSRQKLDYLPEAHTDFILSVVAEELGLVGVLAVLALFAMLLVAGVRIARRARERHALLVATAMTLFLTLPAAINGAVVMGLVPTKGLAMPFLSYGRSSSLACFLALGILVGIARREAAETPPTVAGAERRSLLR